MSAVLFFQSISSPGYLVQSANFTTYVNEVAGGEPDTIKNEGEGVSLMIQLRNYWVEENQEVYVQYLDVIRACFPAIYEQYYLLLKI